MKVLILGAGGQVGRSVAASCPPAHHTTSYTRAQLDITDPRAIAAVIVPGQYDWVVNAAAYTAVDAAEDESAVAVAINSQAVAHISAAATHAGTRLLHLSTDFVFDGESSHAYLPVSPTNPLGTYGATKLAGERYALDSAGGIVLRTSWIYASYGRNFVLTMLKLMRERDRINVVRDQIGSPTWVNSVSQAIWALMTVGASAGIYHWSDAGVASWYDFAVAIQEEASNAGLLSNRIPIIPIPSADYPTRAVRPTFSVLNTDATHSLTGLPWTHWRANLRNMLDELQTR